MISWFDLAYAALTINMIFYCFRAYFSSRKKPFQLLGVGFTCLLIADVVGVVSRAVFYENHYVVVENLSTIRMRFVSSYIEFGLYAAFTLLVLRAIHLVSSPRSGESQNIPLILAGITFVILSQLISEQAGIWFCGPGCDDPFFFPVAFVIAAIYGWWSRNYRYSFLVGFFALPYMLSLTPPYSLLLPFITNVMGVTHYNLVDILIFCAFGIVSGLMGMGTVKWQKSRSPK